MCKTLLFAVLGYTAGVATVLMLLYLFLHNEGFDATHYMIGSALLILFSALWGYAIASDLIIPQRRLFDKLEHTTREVLHEINIPVATIEANVAMLEKGETDGKRLKRLGRIRGATKRLERLYRELRYVLTKEFAPVTKERFDVAEVLYDRIAFFESRTRHRFVLDAEPTTVQTDRIGFEQMLDNLLDNAVKYAPEDTTIAVRLSQGVLSIRDEGEGMDETELVRIFERYYRGDDRLEGEGIGLALVKRFCDEQGIEIAITTRRHQGTTVQLALHTIVAASSAYAFISPR